MLRRPPRSTRTDTLALHDALPILRFGAREASAQINGVGEQYFDVKGVALLEGRLFDADSLRSKAQRSEEHTSELQSLMRISYAVFCLKKKKTTTQTEVAKQERSATQQDYLEHNIIQQQDKY